MVNIAQIPLNNIDESTKTQQKGRKVAAAEKENPVKDLLAALKFLLPTQRKIENSMHYFCIMRNGWVVAENDVLTIGHPIKENLDVCPNVNQLIDALSIVENDVAFTHLAENALSIKSGAFKAVIPCYALEYMNIAGPDLNIAAIDDRIKIGFKQLIPICNEKGKTAHEASILLQANSCVATDGVSILEYWHGIDLPPNILIPKVAAQAVAKSPYELSGFGFSDDSATFYFKNGSFIKTQLIEGEWPEYAGAITNPFSYDPIHPDFIEAVKFAESFSATGNVFMMGDYVRSSPEDQMVSIYKIGNLPPMMGFSAKLIYKIRHALQAVKFVGNATNPKMFFCKENLRGALAGVSLEAERYTSDTHKAKSLTKEEIDFNADDIPF